MFRGCMDEGITSQTSDSKRRDITSSLFDTWQERTICTHVPHALIEQVPCLVSVCRKNLMYPAIPKLHRFFPKMYKKKQDRHGKRRRSKRQITNGKYHHQSHPHSTLQPNQQQQSRQKHALQSCPSSHLPTQQHQVHCLATFSPKHR